MEPTNTEIKALLEQHMAASQVARVESAKDNAAISQQLNETRAEIRAQGVKLLEIDRRISKTEIDVRRLKEEADGLQGHLLAEVGALAHNDKKQNAQLDAIKAETHALMRDRETVLTGISALKRMVAGAVVAVPALYEFVRWAMTHVTL